MDWTMFGGCLSLCKVTKKTTDEIFRSASNKTQNSLNKNYIIFSVRIYTRSSRTFLFDFHLKYKFCNIYAREKTNTQKILSWDSSFVGNTRIILNLCLLRWDSIWESAFFRSWSSMSIKISLGTLFYWDRFSFCFVCVCLVFWHVRPFYKCLSISFQFQNRYLWIKKCCSKTRFENKFNDKVLKPI